MTKLLTFCFLTMNLWVTISTQNPFTLISFLLLHTLLLFFFITMNSYLWFGGIFILTYLGGLMILFMHALAMVKEKKTYLSKPFYYMSMMMLTIFFTIFIEEKMTQTISYNKLIIPSNLMMTFNQIFLKTYSNQLCLMTLILLMFLMIIMKMIKSKQGSLKKH